MILNVVLKASRNPDYSANISSNLLADILILNIPTAYGFYISWYAYSKLLKQIKVIKLTAALITIFISYTLVWYIIDYLILPQLGKDYTPTSQFNFGHFVIVIFYIFIECNIVAFSFQFFKKTINHQRLLREIQNEKLEIEYAFLRAQINPHFLNNTLNFLYAKSLPLSKDLSDGIMNLSEIMRYSLQIDQNNQLMPLTDEIEHLKNVININRLTFNNCFHINLIINGDTNDCSIAPLTLITILENIIKYGDCTDENAEAYIKLQIDWDKNLVIETFNKKKSTPIEHSNGNNIENLQKRLKTYYGNNFKLITNDQESFTILNLKIPNKPAMT